MVAAPPSTTMPINCEPTELAALSKCFLCMTKDEREAAEVYLLAVLAGLDYLTPEALLDRAKCFQCIDHETSLNLRNYLLCQAVDLCAGGGSDSDLEADDTGQRVTTDDGKNIVLNV